MRTFFLLLCSVLALSAQTNTHFGVKFAGQNTNGWPAFWPTHVRALGTSQGPLEAGEALMNWAAVRQCIATNKPTFDTAEAAKRTVANTNSIKLQSLYEFIPKARVWTASTLTTVTNIEASLASGTNNTAQLVLRIRQLNGEVNQQARINAGVLELLQRLGPVLREMYKPETDRTK